MLIYDDFSKKCDGIFKKFLSYLVCVPNFKSINSNPVSKTKCEYDGDNFTPTLHKRLRGQSMLVGIRLIELTESTDTLN